MGFGVLGDFLAPGGPKVVGHAVIEGEEARGRADFRAHVANGAHARAGDGIHAFAEVLDDGAGAPFTVRMPASLRITSFGEVQPFSLPLSFTPMSFGAFSSQGRPTITSTASAPPTPMATMPRPPALGVWESVPIIMPPGNA